MNAILKLKPCLNKRMVIPESNVSNFGQYHFPYFYSWFHRLAIISGM